jgi:hypothetical protein
MELEKTGYPRLLRSRCKNTDATLGGLTCGAIQRKVDEQDRLTQWSLVGGTVGRQHQDKLARGKNRIDDTTNGRTVASGIRDEAARDRRRVNDSTRTDKSSG